MCDCTPTPGGLRTAPEQQNTCYLHVLRIFATCLVVLLHSIAPYLTDAALFGTGSWWLFNILSSAVRMGVPLFFMISGYLMLRSSRTLEIGPFYRRRIPRVLIPFLAWDVIYFIASCLNGNPDVTFRRFLKELLWQGSSYHLWFVYTILGLYLLSPFLKRIVDSCTRRQLWAFLLVILLPVTVTHFLNVFSPVPVYLSAPLIEGYTGYFLFGYLLGTAELTPNFRRLVYLGGLVGALLNVFGNYLSSSPEAVNMVFNAGYSATHYLTAGAVFVLARSAPAPGEKLQAFLARWSGLTYGIYLCHALLLTVSFNLLPAGLHPVLLVAGAFGLSLLSSIAIVWLCSKLPPLRRLLL